MSKKVKIKITKVYEVTGKQRKTQWACNRCMCAWDGEIWCPYCREEATHGEAYSAPTQRERVR